MSAVQVEDSFENPISSLYVKQHPDVIKKSYEYDYSDDMKSHWDSDDKWKNIHFDLFK